MPTKITFLANDLIKDSTVYTGSEVVTLPADNVKNPIVDKVYRSDGVKETYLTFDLGSAKPVDLINLINHNLSETTGEGDGITVEANTVNEWSDGGFEYKGTIDDGGTYYNVWGDGTYIYCACWTSGVRAYAFDDNNFVLKATKYDGSTYCAVWGDGTYIYCACSGGGLRAYSFSGSTFTLLDTIYNSGFYRDVWGDGTYIYCACDNAVKAYTFDGNNFTLKDSQYDGGAYYGVWGDGTYIYCACGDDGVRAYTFDGNSFVLKATKYDDGNYYGLWGDGTYIYCACGGSGVRAYTFDGNDFILKDTQDDGGDYNGVWGDGTYLYCACGGDGVRVYAFIGDDFTLKDTRDDGGDYRDLWGDGTYIYCACSDGGVRAYDNSLALGIPPFTQQFDLWESGTSDAGNKTIVRSLFLSSKQTLYNWWHIKIIDDSNSDEYIEIGRVMAGEYKELAKNFKYDWKHRYPDMSETKQVGSYRSADKMFKFNEIEVEIGCSSDSQKDDLMEIFRQAGTTEDIVVCFAPSTAVGRNKLTFYGRIEGFFEFAKQFKNMNSLAIVFRESIGDQS